MKIPEFFSALRQNTSDLLGLGSVDKLTPTQGLKVDLCASLRLELDRVMAAQLRGEAVDLRSLATAAEMLNTLLKPAEIAQTRDPHEGAREELARFLTARHDAIEAQWARESVLESELEAADWRAAALPPALPQPIVPPPRAHVAYIDAYVVDDLSPTAPSPPAPVPVSVRAAPQQSSSEREWATWYYGGGGSTRQAGWDSPPRGW